MSVVPLRISDATKPPCKPKDPCGTVNIPYGYRLTEHRRNRSNVNLTNDKQSHIPGVDTSLRTKSLTNQDKRESLSENDGTKTDTGLSMQEKTATNAPTASKTGKNLLSGDTRKSISQKEKNTRLETLQKARDTYTKISQKQRDTRVQKPQKDVNKITIIPGNPNEPDKDLISYEERQEKNSLRTSEFVKRTNNRILKKQIRNLIEEGITEYEESINARREKLRSMLLAEEKALLEEVIIQAQRGADLQREETRKRAEELRKRTEEERLATVAEKRMQQYLAKCPELREKFSDTMNLQRKYSNLAQMVEKEAQREAEREEENIWCKVMVNDAEAKKARQVEEERRRMEAEKSRLSTLEKQMASKLALCEEAKRIRQEEQENLDRFWKNVGKNDPLSAAKEREKTARYKRDLKEQMLATKKLIEERAREEEAVIEAFSMLTDAQRSRDRLMAEESISRLQDEKAAYLASVEKIREEEAKREAEMEEIVVASMREVEAKRESAQRRAEEERERLHREVTKIQEQQMREKQARKEEEEKLAALEEESHGKETEVEASLKAAAEAKRLENSLRYGQELKAQQNYAAEMRRRENDKMEKMFRDELEREKKYERLAEQMLNTPEIITPHAFKILEKEFSDRRESAQKALCYSSQSST